MFLFGLVRLGGKDGVLRLARCFFGRWVGRSAGVSPFSPRERREEKRGMAKSFPFRLNSSKQRRGRRRRRLLCAKAGKKEGVERREVAGGGGRGGDGHL